jgi:L-iduronidase
MDVHVNCEKCVGELDHFWRSTGFTPANLLLNADMQQAMAYAGAVPHGGLTYVRIHYLLELVMAEGLGTASPSYDWSRLDTALDALVHHGLRPVFELMGNVAGYFTDYTDPDQAHAWRRLVRDLALHLLDRYGAETVRGWLFETWNEPDIGFWQQSDEAFCTYYDACLEGLKAADPELTLGGPGTCRNLSDTLKTFLDHCDTGENVFTGETGVRLQFISVHEKGVRSHAEDLTPSSMGIIAREARVIDYIREHHPRFADLPFFNDECDPQVGWGQIHTWRARPYYAAIVAKILNQHLVKLVDEKGVNYGLLSNDNGFLGTWGNRTHFARFGEYDHLDMGQAEGKRDAPRFEEDPRRRRFELIKKPVFTVMTLLSLLGDERCAVAGVGDVVEDVGVLATRRGTDQVAVLVYNSRDRIMTGGSTPISLRLEGLPFGEAASVMLAHYRLDEDHGNPFARWEAMGAPQFPTDEQYAELRAHQELPLLAPPGAVDVEDGALQLDFELPLPGVSLVLLCARPPQVPDAVEGLRATRYAGMTEQEEVLLSWDGLPSRCLRTYEVLYAPTAEGDFTRVNGPDQLDLAYLHRADTVAGYYKVRAVDYWDRAGDSSPALSVEES